MKEYIEEVIEKFREEISGRVSLPAQHHLFTVNEKADKLYEYRT